METEIVPESYLHEPDPLAVPDRGELATVDAATLRLLACAASAMFLVCLLVLPAGPSESSETLSWVLAFAVALPLGLLLADRQAWVLATAAPAAPARGIATGVVLLGAALALRRSGAGDPLHHGLIAVAALGALASPFLAARYWRDPADRATDAEWAIALIALGVTPLLFLPSGALRLSTLLPAVVLAALAFAILGFPAERRWSARARHALDAALCVVIALVAVQLPDILPHAPIVAENHAFFLGPANDAMHGRAMLSGAWSQYGVGLIDALALLFTAVPMGFGTFTLIIAALSAALYLCVYGTLRLAGVGQALAVLTVAVAAAGNLFAPLDVYVSYPSDTPLRFGLPYVMILCAVVGARYPARAQPMRIVTLAVLTVAAMWSFETFVYCAGTYGALMLVEAIHAGTGVVRRVLRGAALGLAVSAAAAALLSLMTYLLAGSLDWGPYLEYLRLYSLNGFSQLPVVFFSAGPLMAAAIFASAVLLLWLVRERPAALSPGMRAGLAGFTGLAVVTFTYYLGRSHSNNLLILLIPVVALGGLWTQVLLAAPTARWRMAVAAGILVAGGMIVVFAWPSVERKWSDTALSLETPGGAGSVSASIDRLAENPVLDPRALSGVELLEGRVPSGQPALVLTEPELTTEILIRAGRQNALPISNPSEDALIASSRGRVVAASERVSAGTLLLTAAVPDGYPGFNALQRTALSVLHRRFAFRSVEWTSDGVELVRLVPRAS